MRHTHRDFIRDVVAIQIICEATIRLISDSTINEVVWIFVSAVDAPKSATEPLTRYAR